MRLRELVRRKVSYQRVHKGGAMPPKKFLEYLICALRGGIT